MEPAGPGGWTSAASILARALWRRASSWAWNGPTRPSGLKMTVTMTLAPTITAYQLLTLNTLLSMKNSTPPEAMRPASSPPLTEVMPARNTVVNSASPPIAVNGLSFTFNAW